MNNLTLKKVLHAFNVYKWVILASLILSALYLFIFIDFKVFLDTADHFKNNEQFNSSVAFKNNLFAMQDFPGLISFLILFLVTATLVFVGHYLKTKEKLSQGYIVGLTGVILGWFLLLHYIMLAVVYSKNWPVDFQVYNSLDDDSKILGSAYLFTFRAIYLYLVAIFFIRRINSMKWLLVFLLVWMGLQMAWAGLTLLIDNSYNNQTSHIISYVMSFISPGSNQFNNINSNGIFVHPILQSIPYLIHFALVWAMTLSKKSIFKLSQLANNN